jgi:hypothetical protein
VYGGAPHPRAETKGLVTYGARSDPGNLGIHSKFDNYPCDRPQSTDGYLSRVTPVSYRNQRRIGSLIGLPGIGACLFLAIASLIISHPKEQPAA